LASAQTCFIHPAESQMGDKTKHSVWHDVRAGWEGR
jgi:hypothetical protein